MAKQIDIRKPLFADEKEGCVERGSDDSCDKVQAYVHASKETTSWEDSPILNAKNQYLNDDASGYEAEPRVFLSSIDHCVPLLRSHLRSHCLDRLSNLTFSWRCVRLSISLPFCIVCTAQLTFRSTFKKPFFVSVVLCGREEICGKDFEGNRTQHHIRHTKGNTRKYFNVIQW